jgi:uncharacterized protein DUF6922
MNNSISIKGKKVNNLENVFPKSFFWDVDLAKFSLENWEDRSFIIQRVLKMAYLKKGVLDSLEQLFSIDEIKYYAEGSSEIIGNERIEMLCHRYHMQPSQFPHYFENIKEYMHA